MGFLRNRVTAVSCVVAAGFAVSSCSGSGHTAVAAVATAQRSSGVAACTATFLAMSTGHRSGTTTVTQAINLTNNGTTACVLNGYPGVNVIGRAHGQSQYVWTMRWATTPHTPVTLQPGATAHFDVVYRAAAEGGTAGGSATATASATAAGSATPKATTKPTTAATAKAGAKSSATPSKSTTPVSPPVDIDVLDLTITLPNTFSQDQMAWYADMVLEDKDANSLAHVTPIVAGSA